MHIEIVELCESWGAMNFDGAMLCAATKGHIEIMLNCVRVGER